MKYTSKQLVKQNNSTLEILAVNLQKIMDDYIENLTLYNELNNELNHIKAQININKRI